MASPAACFVFYVTSTLLLTAPFVSPLSFNFSSFDASAKEGLIKLYGNASFVGGRIELTKGFHSVGRAVYKDPVALVDADSGNLTNFTAQFSFRITTDVPNSVGDGMSFFLAPPNSVEIPKGSGDSNLGLFNYTGDLVAVEFDTYSNAPYNDPPSNHIGIDVLKIVSVATVELKNFSLVRDATAHAKVNYDGSSKNMSVEFYYDRNDPDPVARGRRWNLSTAIDLGQYFGDEVMVGFSASTGGGVESHTLFSFSFVSTAVGKIIGPAPTTSRSTRGRWKLPLEILIGVGLFAFGFVLACFLSQRWRPLTTKATEDTTVAEFDWSIDGVFGGAGRGPRSFPYEKLVAATENFADDRKLGEGGFGSVYKGVLADINGMEVAIKRISQGSLQGKREYLAEIAIISRLRHRNLVQLIGYCHEMGELLLVYQYMSKGSLNLHLHDPDKFLAWPERHKIAVGFASALFYLHEEWEQYVIHRDIKPSNIMLDAEFNPRLGDFGLAKLVDHGRNMQTTSIVAGTRVYMAPEYLRTGKASKETDIYSFGLVLLEIACGQKPGFLEDSDRVNIVQLLWELYEKNSCLSAADPRLKNDYDEYTMERLMVVGLWCAHPDCNLRPRITSAIGVLSFDAPLPVLSPPSKPSTNTFHKSDRPPSWQGDNSSSQMADLTNPLR